MFLFPIIFSIQRNWVFPNIAYIYLILKFESGFILAALCFVRERRGRRNDISPLCWLLKINVSCVLMPVFSSDLVHLPSLRPVTSMWSCCSPKIYFGNLKFKLSFMDKFVFTQQLLNETIWVWCSLFMYLKHELTISFSQWWERNTSTNWRLSVLSS